MSNTKGVGLWVVNFPIFRKKNTFNNSSKKTVHERKYALLNGLFIFKIN